jgi:hypothetical protein
MGNFCQEITPWRECWKVSIGRVSRLSSLWYGLTLIFAQNMNSLHNKHVDPLSEDRGYQGKDNKEKKICTCEEVEHICLWASCRGQTLVRTIRGLVNYRFACFVLRSTCPLLSMLSSPHLFSSLLPVYSLFVPEKGC